MPGTFPAAAPVLTGDSLAISRFLQSPTAHAAAAARLQGPAVRRRPDPDQRFRSQGGAVLYEMTEPFVTDRTVDAVGAGL